MAADVSHKFKGGFILDEERLRRINEKLDDRKKELNDGFSYHYKISRNDNYSYNKDDIDRILEEENNAPEDIRNIQIISDDDSNIYYNLEFDNEDGVSIKINGNNRDHVFLLFSDIKEYIQTNVNRVKDLNFKKEWIAGALPISFLAYLIWMMYWVSEKENEMHNILTSKCPSGDFLSRTNRLGGLPS